MPPCLAYVVDDRTEESPVVYLMRLPDGDPLVLQGSGGVIWALAADGVDDVAAALAVAVGSPVDQISADVRSFLDDLVSRGLLDRNRARLRGSDAVRGRVALGRCASSANRVWWQQGEQDLATA